jgi:hypothetical protein
MEQVTLNQMIAAFKEAIVAMVSSGAFQYPGEVH